MCFFVFGEVLLKTRGCMFVKYLFGPWLFISKCNRFHVPEIRGYIFVHGVNIVKVTVMILMVCSSQTFVGGMPPEDVCISPHLKDKQRWNTMSIYSHIALQEHTHSRRKQHTRIDVYY